MYMHYLNGHAKNQYQGAAKNKGDSPRAWRVLSGLLIVHPSNYN
jgi:hypothetical protein